MLREQDFFADVQDEMFQVLYIENVCKKTLNEFGFETAFRCPARTSLILPNIFYLIKFYYFISLRHLFSFKTCFLN